MSCQSFLSCLDVTPDNVIKYPDEATVCLRKSLKYPPEGLRKSLKWSNFPREVEALSKEQKDLILKCQSNP